MTNRRRTWGTGFPDIRGQGRAIRQQEHSAPPRLPTDVQQDPGEREQRALQSALPAPQGGVPTMALTQHRHQPWRHPGSDDHRSATPPPCFPRPCRAAPPIRKRLALELPLLRSPSCSAKAPPSPLNWMNHLPAGTAWQYESTCDSLATPLSCRRDERRVGRRQLEAATDWCVGSTKACAKPFAGGPGNEGRGPHTSKAKAASLLCANFQLRLLGSSRGRPLLAVSLTLYPPPPRCAALTGIQISSAGPCRPEPGGEAHIHVYGGASVRTFGSRLQNCRCKL